jgi:TolA-binding protein
MKDALSSKPEPISNELRELLDAEREIDAPTPAERERMYARIAPLILPLGGAPDAPAGDLGATAGAGGGIGAKLVLVSLISAAVGAGGGAAGHAYYASKRPASIASAPVAIAAPPVSIASEVAPPVEPSPVVPSALPAPSASTKLEEPARSASSLRSERLLLETASAALMKGDNSSAIAALRQHAQRFPKGELAQEREVLLVQALAASGDDAAAQRRAKEFKKKFPGSLQQNSVDKASKPK